MTKIVALHRSPVHLFSKQPEPALTFVAGEGIEGDAHRGVTVKHRSRVRADPTQPNLRQVHLLHAELFDELKAKGFIVRPGDIGENVTTEGIDLLALPEGAILSLGKGVRIKVTGLRNPCQQLNDFQPGLMQAMLDKDAEGKLIRKSGVMGIVLAGGSARLDDTIGVTLPDPPFRRLERV